MVLGRRNFNFVVSLTECLLCVSQIYAKNEERLSEEKEYFPETPDSDTEEK